jgi:uncharacterized DUF497 family protein
MEGKLYLQSDDEPLIYEWDEAKRAANLVKHGVAFDEIWAFDWATAIRTEDRRKDYGEVRW